MLSKEFITRQCAAKGCTRTFKVWPATSKAYFCCLLHANQPLIPELKRLFFPKKKADYVPTFGQPGDIE
jgi:hypothetical protein